VSIFLALLLLLVLPSPWNIVGFAASLVLAVFEFGFWHRRVRGIRVSAGAETLEGASGTVVQACLPEGLIRIRGETWAARCDPGAQVGEKVTVVGRDDLTLIVVPAETPRG
jgi:membrane protein implicated in regulation of membrane protease activity